MKSYFGLLKNNRRYRYLWYGHVISLFGDWFNLLASIQLITSLSSAGLAISTMFLLRFLPYFIVSPLAGVLADKFNRKWIMVLSDIARALLVLGFLLIDSPKVLPLFYLLTILQFSCSALFMPARSAILANVVDPKDLVTANTLDSFTWSTMLALGSFAGGLVATIFGYRLAFIMDALTFLLSAWFIGRVVYQPNHKNDQKSRKHPFWEAVIGIRFLAHNPTILTITLVKGAGAILWGAANVLEVSYAKEIYPLKLVFLTDKLAGNAESAALGFIYLVSGLGTGCGPIFWRFILGDQKKNLLWGIGIGFFALSCGLWLMGFADSFGLFLLATFTRTVGSGTLWVFSATLLQIMVPDQVRGRVFSSEFAIFTLCQSIATLIPGFLIDYANFSIFQATWVFVFPGLLFVILWLLLLPRLQRVASETVSL